MATLVHVSSATSASSLNFFPSPIIMPCWYLNLRYSTNHVRNRVCESSAEDVIPSLVKIVGYMQGSSRLSATEVPTAVYRGKSVPQKIRDVVDPFTVHRYNPCKSCKSVKIRYRTVKIRSFSADPWSVPLTIRSFQALYVIHTIKRSVSAPYFIFHLYFS